MATPSLNNFWLTELNHGGGQGWNLPEASRAITESPPLFPFLLSSCPLPNPPLWVLLLFSSPQDRISSRMKRSLVPEEKANEWADLEQEIGRAGARG